jgi:O-antigen ligase
MIQSLLNNKPIFIVLHILIGYFATFGFFPKPFGYLIIATCLVLLLLEGNNKEQAFSIASYVAGLEVFLRMVKGAPLFEIGKYSIIAILFLGLLFGKTRQRLTLTYPIYLMLLLLGIVLTNVPDGESIKNAIAFNLSGPFMLGVAAIYFYKRRVTKEEVHNALFFFLLPMFSMVTYMYFRTPDFKEIAFGGVSLGETSGGFGPNQVATVLGFGIFILAYFLLIKHTISGFLIIDAAILMYFTFRGLLTFSRGGIITAAIAFVVTAFFYILYKRNYRKILQYVIVAAVFLSAVWVYTSDVTRGMIENRYTGRNASGIKKEDATAGRIKLFTAQLEGFSDAPLFGIGVGNGKYRRFERGDKLGTSHNEVTRLIEEHGVIGLIILLLLFIVPLSHLFRVNNMRRSLLVAFFLFWFLTINHSAMRIAFPGFVYGLALIDILSDE